MAKLKMGLSGLSTPDYIIRCSAIRKAVEENATTFTTPEPSMATLAAAIELLAARQQAVADNPSPDATYLRNAAKEALHPLMVQLATYVAGVANGNGEVILLSGFSITGGRSTVGLLPAPDTFRRQADGIGLGSIRISWNGVERSQGYMVGIAPIDDGGTIGVWTSSKPKRLSHTFESLVSGQLYAMRVATLSSEGQGSWSAIITYRPQ